MDRIDFTEIFEEPFEATPSAFMTAVIKNLEDQRKLKSNERGIVMSVLSTRRKLSKLEYVDGARKLQEYTAEHAINIDSKFLPAYYDELMKLCRQLRYVVDETIDDPMTEAEWIRKNNLLHRAVKISERMLEELDSMFTNIAPSEEAKNKNINLIIEWADKIATEVKGLSKAIALNTFIEDDICGGDDAPF